MIGVGVWNVLGRYIGNAIGQNLSSNALIETQWYLFDLVFLLGAAYALQHDEHVRVDIFYARWSRRRKSHGRSVRHPLFPAALLSSCHCFSPGEPSPNPGPSTKPPPTPGGLIRLSDQKR